MTSVEVIWDSVPLVNTGGLQVVLRPCFSVHSFRRDPRYTQWNSYLRILRAVEERGLLICMKLSIKLCSMRSGVVMHQYSKVLMGECKYAVYVTLGVHIASDNKKISLPASLPIMPPKSIRYLYKPVMFCNNMVTTNNFCRTILLMVKLRLCYFLKFLKPIVGPMFQFFIYTIKAT